MVRCIFGPRKARGRSAILASAVAATVAAALMAGLVAAHPHHNEEEMFEATTAQLLAQGKECDEVLEIEDTPDAVVVTCRVGVGASERPVKYSLRK